MNGNMRCYEVGVDSGQIAILPLASVECPGGVDLGFTVTLRPGDAVVGVYEDGLITIWAVPATESGAVAGGGQMWVGDPCYTLANNISDAAGDWTKGGEGVSGYWGACVASLSMPRDGNVDLPAFLIRDGQTGLVSSTRWGDGGYDATIEEDGDGYLISIRIPTNDTEDEAEEWEEEDEEGWEE